MNNTYVLRLQGFPKRIQHLAKDGHVPDKSHRFYIAWRNLVDAIYAHYELAASLDCISKYEMLSDNPTVAYVLWQVKDTLFADYSKVKATS